LSKEGIIGASRLKAGSDITRDIDCKSLGLAGLTVPIPALSVPIKNILDLHWPAFFESSYVLLVLSALLFRYGGWPFLSGLISELSSWQPGMTALIGVSIAVAFFYSSAVTFSLPGKVLFWESATLIDIMLLGHLIEMKSVVGASRGRAFRIFCGLRATTS
jgi:Cu2+-exporting ATPase